MLSLLFLLLSVSFLIFPSVLPTLTLTPGEPANAKNMITVGASVNTHQSFDDTYCGSGLFPDDGVCGVLAEQQKKHYTSQSVAYFSSMGPTPDPDMRVKPVRE